MLGFSRMIRKSTPLNNCIKPKVLFYRTYFSNQNQKKVEFKPAA